MFLRSGDKAIFIQGEDFEGNNLTGKTAIISNTFSPEFKDAAVTVVETDQSLFVPKAWLKRIP